MHVPCAQRKSNNQPQVSLHGAIGANLELVQRDGRLWAVHLRGRNASTATRGTYSLVVNLAGRGAGLEDTLRASLVILGHLGHDTSLKSHLLRNKRTVSHVRSLSDK